MMIDNELVITVRMRLDPESPAILGPADSPAVKDAIATIVAAAFSLPGQLAGVEVLMPTFEPYSDKEADGQS